MIGNVTVGLRGFNQTWGSDVDVLLVGPAGQSVIVMSDVGSGNVNNVNLTLSDSAAAPLPATSLVSGTYRPTNLSDGSLLGDNFPAPAPAGSFSGTLSAFIAQSATAADARSVGTAAVACSLLRNMT